MLVYDRDMNRSSKTALRNCRHCMSQLQRKVKLRHAMPQLSLSKRQIMAGICTVFATLKIYTHIKVGAGMHELDTLELTVLGLVQEGVGHGGCQVWCGLCP